MGDNTSSHSPPRRTIVWPENSFSSVARFDVSADAMTHTAERSGTVARPRTLSLVPTGKNTLSPANNGSSGSSR